MNPVLIAAGVLLLAAAALMWRRHRGVQVERDSFFAMSLDLMCIAGVDGFFKRVNPAFGVLGWEEKELLSRPYLEFVHPDDAVATRQAMEKLKRGEPVLRFESRFRCKDGSYRWLSWSCRPAGPLLYAAATDITARKEMEEIGRRHAEEMRALTLVDELTGLGNRRGFLTLARQHLRNAARTKTAAAILFIDLDGLKAINDKHGHEAGDNAIRTMADILRKTFRGADIAARLGGDEFVVLAADTADPSPPLRRMATYLKDQRLSASVGFTIFDPGKPEPVEDLLQKADAAMYEQKQKKKPKSKAR